MRLCFWQGGDGDIRLQLSLNQDDFKGAGLSKRHRELIERFKKGGWAGPKEMVPMLRTAADVAEAITRRRIKYEEL